MQAKSSKKVYLEGNETIVISSKMQPKTSMIFYDEELKEQYALIKTSGGKFRTGKPFDV